MKGRDEPEDEEEELDPTWKNKMVSGFQLVPNRTVPENNSNSRPVTLQSIPSGEDWKNLKIESNTTAPQSSSSKQEIFPESKRFLAFSSDEVLVLQKRLETMKQPSTTWEKFWVSKVDKKPLTMDDEDAQDDWVAGGWDALNKYKRGLLTEKEINETNAGKKTITKKVEGKFVQVQENVKSLDRRASDLETMLKKLDPHKGSSYRRVDPKSDISTYAKKIRPGDYIIDKGFSASSVVRGGEGAGSGWGKPGGLYFDIVGTSGKNLTPYSRMKGEGEVLFLPGTVFLVQAIEVDKDQTVWVLLKEADLPLPLDVKVKNAFTGE